MLEILDCEIVGFGALPGAKGSQVAPTPDSSYASAAGILRISVCRSFRFQMIETYRR
jgi:hypothetical protein